MRLLKGSGMEPEEREQLIAEAANALRREVSGINDALPAAEPEGEEQLHLQQRLAELAAGIASVSEALAATRLGPQAELLLAPILESTESLEEPEPVLASLAAIGEPETRELNVAMVRWLVSQPTAVLREQIPRLSPVALGERAGPELGKILVRLWREADEEGAEEAFEAMRELLAMRGRARVKFDILSILGAIRSAASAPATNPTEADAQTRRLRLLAPISGTLIKRSVIAPQVLDSAIATLGATVEPGSERRLISLVREELSFAAPDAEEEKLIELAQALDSCSWREGQSPEVETLTLQLAAARAAEEEDAESPLSSNEVADLAREYRNEFAEGVAIWLASTNPRPNMARGALSPYLPGPLRPPLREAAEAYAEDLGPMELVVLLEDLLSEALTQRPKIAVLRQLRIDKAAETPLSAKLVALFGKATRMPEREEILVIWEAIAPTEQAVRRELIRKVFIPLSAMGVGGYELCRKHLELCAEPPHGTKSELIEALSKAPDKDRGKRMAKRLEGLDLRPTKKSWRKRLRGG
jgi:hypothetical protein